MTDTNTRPAKGTPSHVPEDLVRAIEVPMGPIFLAAPYDYLASLHETYPPVFFTPGQVPPGTWMLRRYDDCRFVLEHPEIFNNNTHKPFPRDPANWFDLIPLEIDPPHHARYRAILAPTFAPAAIAGLRDFMADTADGLIRGFITRRACDFITDFARPLAVSIFLRLMGLPHAIHDDFARMVAGFLDWKDRERSKRSMEEISALLRQVIREKAQRPDAGAISAIVNARPDGKALSDGEVFGYAFFLFLAGLDTVCAVMSHSILWIAAHPERRDEVTASLAGNASAVDEFLRLFGVTYASRVLSRDWQMHGVEMCKGDRVTCLLPAANYDPDTFRNPRVADFSRGDSGRGAGGLTLGAGVHGCMGDHLTKLELKVALQQFLRRVPAFRVADGSDITFLPGGVIAPASVPLVW